MRRIYGVAALGWRIAEGYELQVSAVNLLDKKYVSTVGTNGFSNRGVAIKEAYWVQRMFEDTVRIGGKYLDVISINYYTYGIDRTFVDGVVNAVRIVLSYLWAQVRPSKVEDTFEQWVTNRFGRRLYEIFFKTYTEKVWGMPCDEMSADWAAQRIKGLSLWGAVVDGLKRSLGLNKRPNDGMQTKTLLETFRYPRLGPGMMWERCHELVEGQSTTADRGWIHTLSGLPLRSGHRASAESRSMSFEPDRSSRSAGSSFALHHRSLRGL